MKKLLIIASCIVAVVTVLSCNGVRRNPGHAYMPDMVYSVAYETYAASDERLSKYGAQYNHQPVSGTIARGDMFPYTIKNDTAGLTQSTSVKNPLPALDPKNMTEANRLYLVNCAICHGAKLDGNGPLYKDGNGPFSAKPADLMASKMTDGNMFHVVTYGKGQMGSYASQLSSQQRWMIVSYVKGKQAGGGAGGGTTTPDSTNTGAKMPAPDTTKTQSTKP